MRLVTSSPAKKEVFNELSWVALPEIDPLTTSQ
jgi:hypothetical protein